MTKSFCIDHRFLEKGFYFQEERENVFIYDWRIYAPKDHIYLNARENHTLEHFFANYLNERTEFKKVAIFPYGCLTGFGVILGRKVSEEEIVGLLTDFIEDTIKAKKIPGSSIEACGNPSTLEYSAIQRIIRVIKKDLPTYKFTYEHFVNQNK